MIKHKLTKGYDVKLAGKTDKFRSPAERSQFYALQPPDFPGIKPKLEVEVGTIVKIGTPLFIDKQNADIKFVAPASGVVSGITRGERRSIQEIIIKTDDRDEYEEFTSYDAKKIENATREELIKEMLSGGIWPYIRQRPFSRIADATAQPRDIFIVGMDTAPLAPDYKMLLDGQEDYFALGLKILARLTEGKLFLSVDGSAEERPKAFENLEGVEVHTFAGPHPVGNPSVFMHHVKPINVGEIVWYIYAAHVALIGKFFQYGKFPIERLIAVAGSSIREGIRKYYDVRLGLPIQALVNEGALSDENVRYISGNVFSGRKLYENGFMGFYDNLLTVIPESTQRDFFGWLTPGLKDESFSRTFLSRFFRSDEYVKDTRMHGGKRAFIQTGDYEKLMPMDILPSHLVKAIMAEEIEDMIGLGLLEVDEEDFALCSYICPSKIDFGDYIRQGLEILEKEG